MSSVSQFVQRSRFLATAIASLAAFAFTGCEPSFQESSEGTEKSLRDWSEPDRVRVQHILIKFAGPELDEKISADGITRDFNSAGELADELLQRAKSGEDFEKLCTEYSDDVPPGIYNILNYGVPGADLEPEQIENKIIPRSSLEIRFCNVSFSLDIGEIGLAKFHEKKCRHGFHIIKRLK